MPAAAPPSGASTLHAARRLVFEVAARDRDPGKNPKTPEPAAWTAYDRDLLRSLRIGAPRERPEIRDPRLFSIALAMLISGVAMLGLWIAHLVRMWD